MQRPVTRTILGAVIALASLAALATEAGAATPGGGGATAPACQSGDFMTLSVVASPATVSSGVRVTVSGRARTSESQVTVAGGGTRSASCKGQGRRCCPRRSTVRREPSGSVMGDREWS